MDDLDEWVIGGQVMIMRALAILLSRTNPADKDIARMLDDGADTFSAYIDERKRHRAAMEKIG